MSEQLGCEGQPLLEVPLHPTQGWPSFLGPRTAQEAVGHQVPPESQHLNPTATLWGREQGFARADSSLGPREQWHDVGSPASQNEHLGGTFRMKNN